MPPQTKGGRRCEGVLAIPSFGLKVVGGVSKTQTTKVDVRMSTEELLQIFGFGLKAKFLLLS